MKSSSQSRLPNSNQQPLIQSKPQTGWADQVASDQISRLLSFDLPKLQNPPNMGNGNSSLFTQFNEKQRALGPQNKTSLKLNSQGSSRSSAQTANTLANKSGLQHQPSAASSSHQFSPRESHTATSANSKQISNSFVRSSTQEATSKQFQQSLLVLGRRSMRPNPSQNIGQKNQTELLPDLSKVKAQQNPFNTNKNTISSASNNGFSPHQERISGSNYRNQGKARSKLPPGVVDGSSSERLFHQLIKSKEEQNKENIQDDQISTNSKHNSNNREIMQSQSSRLPMKMQRSFTTGGQQSQMSQNDSFTHKSSTQSLLSVQNNSLLEKQMKEINKQKELLLKLQREKEELEQQMQNNDKMINNRMQRLHNERKQMEEKIVNASTVIQRYARGFICRLRYKRMIEDERQREKDNLNNVLLEMETQIKTCFNVVDYQIEKSVVKIQTAVRKMLARKHFRISLYKLMLLKNILENKVHKEKMQMLYAFEQLIINTEDEEDQAYYDEVYGGEDDYGEEGEDCGGTGPMGIGGGYYRAFPTMQRIPIEAEYLSNPSDIIDEEECEDSEEEKEHEAKQRSKSVSVTSQQQQPHHHQKHSVSRQSNMQGTQGKIITKVTANDLMEFAGQTPSNQAFDENEYQIERDCEIFGNTKNLNQTNDSLTALSTINNQRKGSEESKTSSNKLKSEVAVQQEPPKVFTRRIQPSQQQKKTKILALPPPEPEPVKQIPQRPVDMERIKVLSQPKSIVELEDEEPIVKKKPQKPPMIPGTKKKKCSKKSKETPLAIANDDNSSKPKKVKRRRSSRGLMNVYERLLQHRESRTALKQKSQSQQPLLAIEYKPEYNQAKNQQKIAKLPQNIGQQQQQQTKKDSNKSEISMNRQHPLITRKQEIEEDTINSSTQEFQTINESQDYSQTHQQVKVHQRNDLSNQRQNSDYEIQQKGQLQYDQIQRRVLEEQRIIKEQEEQREREHQMRQQQQQQQDPSMLYKKCFPNANTLSFKDRFPLFADIISKYNKNLRHISGASQQNQQQQQPQQPPSHVQQLIIQPKHK